MAVAIARVGPPASEEEGRDVLGALLVVLIGAFGVAAEGATLPALPPGWPTTLQLGLQDSPGGAARLAAIAPGGFRYQYISGGVNTGSGWANWNPGGAFVTGYVQ